MAQSNGSLKASNGHVNGKVNGKANGKANGKPLVRRQRPSKKGRGVLSWTTNAVARLSTWFAIYTVLFRCPSTLDACDETSPFLCPYYFKTKDILTPHVQPYYDQYAAPYVEIAQPYYNTLNNHVIHPTRAYAVQYGGPWVESAREYGLSKWEKNGQPELQKLQNLAQGHYDKTLAPYLNQAGDTLEPYYDIARTNALQVYYEYLVPGYGYVQPYASQGYNKATDFTTTTAIPAAWWAWGKTHAFLDTAVWPHLRIVYLENVEPQLVRIGERLGRYKTKVKAKSGDASVADR
jgi:hypothetical protein